MKKDVVLVFILALLTLSFSVSAQKDMKADSEVRELLENQENARVFIHIKDSEIKSGRALQQIESQAGIKLRHNFKDYVSADVNSEQLAKLEENDYAESITLVGAKKAMLQDSAPLINSTLAHTLQLNGINLTGQGQAVCVIDTGINYSHPDFGGCFGNNNITSDCKIIGGWNTVLNSNNTYDANGHGTHVAGIAAANGAIKGIATEARIVVINAYNESAGVFYDDDLLEAINWCVDNSSLFNISVISMSLGGDVNYTNYCDNDPRENSDLYSEPINAAVAKNISVVISTGNSGNYTGIGSPACIANATPVGWSNKNDTINADSNRNFLVSLIAPGTSINSTYRSGYFSLSGTSMAAPHVAGAIAVISQYLRLAGTSKTPNEIESALNSTGRQVVDEGYSNLTFSRINIYAAILELDATLPSSALISPLNASVSSRTSQILRCNATDWQISNITFYLWNASNSSINVTTLSAEGAYNESDINITGLSSGNYTWNCLSGDKKSNYAFASSNFTFTVDNALSFMNVRSPVNNTVYIANQSIMFNVTLAENGSCFYDLGSGNITMNTSDNRNFYHNATGFENRNYNATFYCNDTAGNSNSSLITFNFKNTGVTLSPANNSYVNSAQSNKTFNCSVRSLNYAIANVTFYIWNASNYLLYNETRSITGLSNSTAFNYILTNETKHYWNCIAYNNNSEESHVERNYTLTYDATKPVVNLRSPADDNSDYDTADSIPFKYNVSDANNITNCSLMIDSAVKTTDVAVSQNSEETITSTITSSGDYHWYIKCYDAAANSNDQVNRDITIQAVSSSDDDDGGGGGGGGGDDYLDDIASYNASEEEEENENEESSLTAAGIYGGITTEINRTSILEGYSLIIQPEEIIIFTVESEKEINLTNSTTNTTVKSKIKFNESHSITIESISNITVNLTVRSSPINFELKIGEEKKLNLTSKEYYNLYIKLNSINSSLNEANITLREIRENTKKEGFFIAAVKLVSGFISSICNKFKRLFLGYTVWILLALAGILVLVIIGAVEYIIIKKRLREGDVRPIRHEHSTKK